MDKKQKYLTIGVSRLEITPPLGVPTGGGGPDGYIPAKDVLDPLYLRSLFIFNEVETMIFVQADLLGLSRTKSEQIVSAISSTTKVARENIIIVCPQTHNSGTTFNEEFPEQILSEFSSKEHREWYESLDKIAVKAAVYAIASAKKAVCSLQKGVSGSLASGRRGLRRSGKITMSFYDPEPEEIVSWSEFDPEIICLRFAECETGKPIAGIWHYTSHPNCTWMLPVFTRGYPGVVEDILTKDFGDDFISLFFNGFCGDVDPYRKMNVDKYVYTYPFYKELQRDLSINIKEMRRLGNILGQSVSAIMKKQFSIDLSCMSILREQVECKIRDAGKDVQYFKYFTKNVELVTVRLGAIALVHLPFEPMAAIGLRIKKLSPAKYTIMVGHSPCYNGYLPDHKVLLEGGMEAETNWRGYADGTAEKIENIILSQLNVLFAKVK